MCFCVKMETQLSDVQSLMGSIMLYLVPKDVARCRQVSKARHANTVEVAPNWQHYVQLNYPVRQCGICKSLRAMRKTEWCALCENYVCVDHLYRCHSCPGIYCSECVYHCCG